jgi:hypothetical protein
MSAVAVSRASVLSLHALHAGFLTIWPRIERHGHIYFRHLRCPHQKADAIAEMVALSWSWYVRLAQRGKDATRFPSTLATFAARAVRAGRRVCGQEPAKDVLSPTGQRRHHFAVERLPDISPLSSNSLTEALCDNTQTPPPEQAAFRLDFPAWLRTRSERGRPARSTGSTPFWMGCRKI